MDKISCRILVVDDDRMLRRFYSDVLLSAGYKVDSAMDGLDALEKLKENEYNAILTDVKMPGLDGISLFNIAARRQPLVAKRFIFMTGDLSDGLSSVLKQTGQRTLLKPFGIGELLCGIETLVIKDLGGIGLQETPMQEGFFARAY